MSVASNLLTAIPSEMRNLNLVFDPANSNINWNFIDCEYYNKYITMEEKDFFCNITLQHSLSSNLHPEI